MMRGLATENARVRDIKMAAYQICFSDRCVVIFCENIFKAFGNMGKWCYNLWDVLGGSYEKV